MFDVSRAVAYWEKHPPLRDLVSAIFVSLGGTVPDASNKPKEYMTGAALKALVDATGGKL